MTVEQRMAAALRELGEKRGARFELAQFSLEIASPAAGPGPGFSQAPTGDIDKTRQTVPKRI